LNRTESLRNSIVILALLILTGVTTAVWPLISSAMNITLDFGFGSSRPPVEAEPVIVPVPAPLVDLVGTNEIVMTMTDVFLVFLGMFVFVLISVVVVGAIISFLIRMLDKSATAVFASDRYKQGTSNLDKKEKERIQQKRTQSPKPNEPEDYAYQLDPLSLSLIILLFVGSVATLAYSLLVPTGELTLFGLTLTSSMSVMLFFMLLAIPLLALLVRRHRLEAIPTTDNAPIPWDFIAILTTGLLIVGVGLGIMLFIYPG
jgi:hypothetical protein